MQLARGIGGPAAPIHKGPLITPVPGTAGTAGKKNNLLHLLRVFQY